ncbi:MAG: ABC transporter permease, partial [Rhizobiales bacterium 17-65-6]
MKRLRLLILQLLVAVVIIGIWHVGSTVKIPAGIISQKAFFPLDPFFFSTPLAVFERTWRDFYTGVIWYHLGITLLETALAFVIGAAGGVLVGFWFARQQLIAAVFDPYVKMANALPRVVLAPI